MDQDYEIKEFSRRTRTENIEKLQSEKFDILVIGGGITGAGVARDAARRGYRVALVEAQDFASGTSSKSSKLIHGGIRYLENRDFKLVFEALSERNKLFKMAPHLTHPLRFMIPLYKDSRVGMMTMSLGMWLYDGLSLFQAPKLHERLNPKKTLERMPIIKSQQLEGAYVYSDGYMDDDRLVIETLRSAQQASAIIANYVKVEKTLDCSKKIKTLWVQDLQSKKNFEIKAQHVISTVGPWTDLVGPDLVKNWNTILRPTKGVHLTFRKDRLPLTSAVVMAAEKSNRIVFAIPRYEMVIIGTTDTDFSGDPAKVSVTPEDVKYLLEITNQYFPKAKITESDIVASYAGVRPLVKDDSDSEGKTSREHKILHFKEGFSFIAGGKYTTYRKMSEDIIDQVAQFFSEKKQNQILPCSTNEPLNQLVDHASYEAAIKQAAHGVGQALALRHGHEGQLIKEMYSSITQDYWQLEALHAIDHTMCLNITDFYSRRVHLVLAENDHGLSYLDQIAEMFKNRLQLSQSEITQQKKDLMDYLDAEFSWRKSFK